MNDKTPKTICSKCGSDRIVSLCLNCEKTGTGRTNSGWRTHATFLIADRVLDAKSHADRMKYAQMTTEAWKSINMTNLLARKVLPTRSQLALKLSTDIYSDLPAPGIAADIFESELARVDWESIAHALLTKHIPEYRTITENSKDNT